MSCWVIAIASRRLKRKRFAADPELELSIVSRALDSRTAVMVCLVAWVVPGAGHLWLGRLPKGCIFFVALSAMFSIGLMLEGELFSIEPSQPLVALAALADLGIGAPYFIAQMFGFGVGRVVATTYEYGNSFLIVSGLLNMLVVLDVFDLALGRK